MIADATDVYVLACDASDAALLSDDELAELEAGLAESDRGNIRYWVYYRVRGTRLEVVSVSHSSRGSGPAT